MAVRIRRSTDRNELSPQLDEKVIEHALSSAPARCDLMKAHLSDIIDQTDDAARAIMERLAATDDLATRMGHGVADVSNAVAETQRELGHVRSNGDAVGQLVRFFMHRDHQMRQLVDEMRGLGKHIAAIEAVSRATRILALNASIEAARAGDHGLGFAVVADEVRTLAGQSSAAAQDIGASIADLTGRLDAVLADDSMAEGGDVGTDIAADTPINRRLTSIEAAQRELARTMDAVLAETVAATRQVDDISQALSANTMSALGEVQFQDIGRQLVEHVASTVDDLRQQTDDVTAYAAGRYTADEIMQRVLLIEDRDATHVMKRQRDTHAAVTRHAAEGDDQITIELF